MNSRVRIKRVLLAVGILVLLPLLALAGLILRVCLSDNPYLLRRVKEVKPHDDVRWRDLSGLDLRSHTGLVQTLGANLRTTWPPRERMPGGIDGGMVLTNGMNPGLGVRDLHHQGITGRGVNVAIIDYYMFTDHPEYAGNIAGFLDLSQTDEGADKESKGGIIERTLIKLMGPRASMHGPAVASLLVGKRCGTAPGARLYFVATPDPGGDAAREARGLDWILEQNRQLPPDQKIRVVSVSSSPSGKNIHPVRNGHLWDEACARAEAAGVLVIDAALHHGFVGPCNLDPEAPEDASRCAPVPARNQPKLYEGRLLAPVGPRTTAEESRKGRYGYQFTGLHEQTFWLHGSSWSMPYVAGVLALGWQVSPGVSAQRMKQLLFESAYVRPGGEKIINPKAFIEALRGEGTRAVEAKAP
jgi:serine protease AprX